MKYVHKTQSRYIWGTFQLTHEPFLEPPELLLQAMREYRVKKTQFRALKIGETIEIADNQ